ncbi:hypothetical protein [Henriciella sp.]|uniref:alanine-zipper protein n=1 Tax=Henriciella sp. TaxID=1968823 RepID=UPI00262947B0|nr:hypothetical protein [Henriciella sp.]
MKIPKFLAILVAGITLASCESIPEDQTIAEYCATSDHSSEAICRMNVEVEGNTTALADTKLSLEEARAIAEAARSSANEANQAAASAQQSADEALARADEALSMSDLDCMTNTINQSDTGTCPTGYTVMGCTQTRYTTRAGGLSFLRELDNDQCRFNSQVLEMDVRCCRRAKSDRVDATPVPADS